MTDPVNDIEEQQAWISFGRQAALLYMGAKSEGLGRKEALQVVTAFVRGMFAAQKEEES